MARVRLVGGPVCSLGGVSLHVRCREDRDLSAVVRRPFPGAKDDQAYLGPRATSGPGDKMMDWVPPAGGGLRPLILWRPSQGPARQSQHCELTVSWREPAALIPIG